jgi:hypothetical protein
VNPYRVRTAARFAAIFLLVAFAVAISAMQRQLASIAAGSGSNRPPATRFNPSREVEDEASRMFGVAASVVAGSDLDGDGRIESLVEARRPAAHSRDLSFIARIAVLSPLAAGGYRVLFDSGRPGDLPRADLASALWQADLLTLTRMDLFAVTDGGQARDYRVEITWDAAGRRYVARRIGGRAEVEPQPPPALSPSPAPSL